MKKKPNQQQIGLSRANVQEYVGRHAELKHVSSPSRKVPVVNSKVKIQSKSPSNSELLKSDGQKDAKDACEVTQLSRNKNKINNDINVQHDAGGKSVKKSTSQISTLESIKKFPKTTKIPTLKSSSVKSIQKHESQMQKSQKSQQKQNNLSEITISTLRTQIDALKTQNDELKKQNQKLNKKVQKLKSLNDDNKKSLKQRIQNFNSQGDSLRKHKEQINDLMRNIENLQQNVKRLEQQNNKLKNDTQKLALSKEQKQIQTYIVENQIKKQGIQQNNDIHPMNPQQLSERNYHSTSSRKSYGGVLPLQTVYDLNNNSIKIDLRTAQSTPQKSIEGKEKLLNKYENYWSVKLGKEEATQNLNEFSYQLNLEVKSQCPQIKKDQQKYLIPSDNSFKQNTLILKDKMKDFSPTILVEKYEQISQQQQLIDSLYRIIDQISRQMQEIQREKITIQKANEDFARKITNLVWQNSQLTRKIQEFMGTSLQHNLQKNENKAIQVLQNNQINDQTLLLDETRQQKVINTKDDFDPAKNQKRQRLEIKSAIERSPKIKEFEIIQEISKFFNSDVLCQCSRNSHQFVDDREKMIEDFEHLIGDQLKQTNQKDMKIQNQTMPVLENSLVKIQDSLEALQYFSTHTPQNMSSEVSFLNVNQDQQQSQDKKRDKQNIEEKQNVTQMKLEQENSLHDQTTNPNSVTFS